MMLTANKGVDWLAFLMPPVNRTDRLPAVSGLGSSTAAADGPSPNSAMPTAAATVMPSNCLRLQPRSSAHTL